jgi:hypothetical protein
MDNAFIRVVETAKASRWCTKWLCSTCGSRAYREALSAIAGPLGIGGELADALSSLEPRLLRHAHQGWADCLRIALFDIGLGREGILESWLSRGLNDVRFVDHVLFDTVRFLPRGSAMRSRWVAHAKEIAASVSDPSLVESLLWSEGAAILEDRAFSKLAEAEAQQSPAVARAMESARGRGE